MTVYGGYLLTPEQAQDLAAVHFPNAERGTAESPSGIRHHFAQELVPTDYVYWPRPGEHTNFLIVGQVRVTHDPSETPWRCKQHKETEFARKIREKVFGPHVEELPWLKDVKWVTVPDPRMEIMDMERDWKKRKEAQRKRLAQDRDSSRPPSQEPEDDTAERSTQYQNNGEPSGRDEYSDQPSRDGASERPAEDTNDQLESGQDEDSEQPPDDEQSTPRQRTLPLLH
ncbi:hypothetical protein PLICRDRAFT_46922 [Plicaturopsis crispa FD-325 SS-3]|uniref:Uncharacterized protein n=1 Tax=Plicaturopsis crispa FD-325 SS-3 TaxID=944288 RepID=A0A0C9SKH4_PLICR|nr:hypothetical protein PLICRDRAFT_46922 [Plicaturopsis crispa FD-325 SS-3]